MSTDDDSPTDPNADSRDLAAEMEELRTRVRRLESALGTEWSRRRDRALEQRSKDEADDAASVGTEPAISRWRRRRGAGPRGVRLADDFDAPLSDFDGY